MRCFLLVASIPTLALFACGGRAAVDHASTVAGRTVRGELAVGELRSLDDPRLGPEMAQLGVFHTDLYVRSAAPGLHMLEPFDPDRTPVVFVHGYGGHPHQLSTLIAALDEERYQPWVYQYPSGWPLERSANELHDGLETLRARHGYREVRIVAHSMGGLVSRAMLKLRAARSDAPYVAELITLASPLGGMPSAAEGADRSPMVIASWPDLAPDGSFVRGLTDTPLPQRTRYVLVSADDGGGETDGTVSLTHQLPEGSVAEADRVVRVRATHTGVLASPEVVALLTDELAARL